MTRALHRLSLYRLAVVLAAGAFLAGLSDHPVYSVPDHLRPWWGLAFLLTLAMVAESWPLRLPRYGSMSLADCLCFAAMILYGPAATVAVAVAGGVSRFLREMSLREVRGDFIAYSLAQNVLSYGVGACLFVEYARAGWHNWLPNTLVTVAAVAATFLVQGQIVALHQWLEQGQMGLPGTRVNWERLRLALQATAPLGALIAVTLQVKPWAVFLLLAPLAVTYLSIKNYTDTLREAREVIESLAEAVEKREPLSLGHANRVAAYAADIARELGLEEMMVDRVATAGRLHDLGKISVDEAILSKADELDPQEVEAIRRHPEIGAQVASRLSLSREEAEFIRYHHEWFDGGGYPYGLRGEAIPLGARILAVAEAFDTMITPRAYSQALSRDAAMNHLRTAGGAQFDPAVVAAFEKTLTKRERFVCFAQ